MDEKNELFEWGQGERIASEILQKLVDNGIKSLSDLARCDIDILLRDYGKAFNKLQSKRFHTSIKMLREKLYPSIPTADCCSATSPPRREEQEATMMEAIDCNNNAEIVDDFDNDKNDSYCKGALERAEKKASRASLLVQFDQENDVLNLLNALILGNEFDDDDVWGKCTQFRKNSKERLKLSKDFHQARAKRLLDLLESTAINDSNSSVAASPLSPRPRSSSFRVAKSGQRRGCLKRALSTENRRQLKIQFDSKVLDWVNKTVVQLATEKPKGSTSVSKREEEYERLQRLEREQKEKNKGKWQCSMCKSYSEEKFRRCQVCSSKRYTEESYFSGWYFNSSTTNATKSYYYPDDISSSRSSSIYNKESGVGVGASRGYGAVSESAKGHGGTTESSRGYGGATESAKGYVGGAESSRGYYYGAATGGATESSAKGYGGTTESSRGYYYGAATESSRGYGGVTESAKGHGGGAESSRGHGVSTESAKGHGGTTESSRGHGGGATESAKGHGGATESSRGNGAATELAKGSESSRGYGGAESAKGHGGATEPAKGYGVATESSRGNGATTEPAKGYGVATESSRSYGGAAEPVKGNHGLGGTDSPKGYGGGVGVSTSYGLPEAKVKNSSTSAASTITSSLYNYYYGTSETSQYNKPDSKCVISATSVPPSLAVPQKAFCQHCFDRERLAGKKFCQICEGKKLKPWGY